MNKSIEAEIRELLIQSAPRRRSPLWLGLAMGLVLGAALMQPADMDPPLPGMQQVSHTVGADYPELELIYQPQGV